MWAVFTDEDLGGYPQELLGVYEVSKENVLTYVRAKYVGKHSRFQIRDEKLITITPTDIARSKQFMEERDNALAQSKAAAEVLKKVFS